MKMNWLVCAALTVCATAPALAQTDATAISYGSTTNARAYTNVDARGVQDTMDTLRGYLERIQDNNRLAFAASDAVHVDAYRRNNKILLDNATGLAQRASQQLGPATKVPAGWGAVRDHIALVEAHLRHSRMFMDFGVPINEAKKALDDAYMSLDRSSRGMSR